MDTTRLSSKGQIVLPKSVRERHGWKEGTELVVESAADGVVLRARKPFAPTRVEDVFGALQYRGRAKRVEDMEAGIARAVRKRHRSV
jgi:AbrB family looped-hinge helix DNA binding protein